MCSSQNYGHPKKHTSMAWTMSRHVYVYIYIFLHVCAYIYMYIYLLWIDKAFSVFGRLRMSSFEAWKRWRRYFKEGGAAPGDVQSCNRAKKVLDYLLTYLLACLLTDLLTYLHTHTHADLTSLPTYLPTYIHTIHYIHYMTWHDITLHDITLHDITFYIYIRTYVRT